MRNRRLGRLLLAIACGMVAALTASPAALAGPGDFYSSFEDGEPAPTWVDTAERASGVSGPKRDGLPGDVTDKVFRVEASGENEGAGEVAENLVDGSAQTKWLVFESTGWVEMELSEPVAVVHYALTSANDAEGRDPRDWTLSGSNDGQSWTVLDTQTDQEFSERFQQREFRFANTTAYTHYRLDITENHGDDIVQLAEIALSNGDTSPPPPSDVQSRVGDGPRGGYTAKSGVGFTGLHALRYAGTHEAEGRGYSYNKIFDVDVPVGPTTELSYLIYPDFVDEDLSYPSTYTSVDLVFTDGTSLSDLNASDQHGATVSPRGQQASKTLYTNQWNFKRSRIGAVAAGKTIDRILVAYDNPDGPTEFGGWIDDITIEADPPQRQRSRPSDWVVTNRGTNSTSSFSRGNNIPATAVPHGFNFWIPVTNAASLSWLYDYHRGNNEDNLPEVQAFAASHEPSPWMGERQTFQVMPSGAEGAPPTGRSDRALAFRHSNEVTSPHHYAVKFENGIETEIAPTDHAAMFRFTFPAGHANLVFDNVNDDASLTIDQASDVVTGYSDVRSGLSNGATRMFFYATFDRPMTASSASGRTGYAKFDAGAGNTVTMRIASSLISLDQARENLALEIAPADTFADIRRRAQAQWDDKLGVIEVEGATEDQLTTLYSNLYRLFLYPNSAFENTGTAQSPVYRHAVQSSTSTPASTPTRTGAPVVDGKVYVNNGFWDTYRTAWSAYSLFAPRSAGELVDGFVQQYRDGGWVSRWSSPGYANLMTGTSSDVSFADAFVKGIHGIDARDTYDAAVKNATVAPPGSDPNDTSVGRKGLIESIFRGYTTTDVSEGVSWALEGYVNDFGIANMAKAMADRRGASTAERQRLEEEHEYFINRARNYVNMFDPRVEFFQGRRPDGRFKSPPSEYNPLVWGHDHDYTETNGWNFAFHVPHDGQGLANLYGGRDGLADKLDEFFATPETAKFPGSYGGIIHEMVEARDVRMGQWGFSNQVSHHIPWMYTYAGQPYKTQEKVREVLRRMYIGSEIGQGYAGDEDNGETSAWYLFAAMGIYPLQVGSPNYVIGSPLFKKATIRRPGGDIVVNAPRNSSRNVYVQGLTIDGKRHDQTYLSHEQLADGATLTFDMGSQPSRWATGKQAAPPSITEGDEVPQPLRDATGGDDDVASDAALFDDTSGTRATAENVEYRFASGERHDVRFYTLTSGDTEGADPSSWVVKGSNDGSRWTVLDRRSDETFMWRSQTRPFELDRNGKFSQLRIEFGGAVRLAEVELLTHEPAIPAPLFAEVASGVTQAGGTAEVPVTLTNDGTSPLSGEVTATAPDGWTVEPVVFGPIEGGQSQTVTLNVTVPDGVEPGAYPVSVTATAGGATARAAGTVHVVGNVVEFTPGTSAEEPWLFEDGASQLNGTAYDGRARFADNERFFVYRFPIGENVTGGTLSLDIGNEFLVQASTDGTTWTTVLREEQEIRDLSNRDENAWRELDVAALAAAGQTLYLRIGDSFPADGWGGWLARLRLELQTGG
ncbi:MAG TPA: GH92 family glycosyl hydrolase [Solirubrobacteraceae bacterium]|nr:GH92 family glycosyl hydrolase [Solirubrobacteraceae bacterium]